jgi:hypothetical protein
VFENTESPSGFTVDSVLSSDDGLTWHSRSRLYTPTKGNAGAPDVVNVWGILVVSFMTNEDHDVGDGKLSAHSVFSKTLVTDGL